MHGIRRLLMLVTVFAGVAGVANAAGIDPAMQAKITARVQAIKTWAADPAIVQAVKSSNAALAPEYVSMTQEKWASLTVLDPLVRAFTRNEAAAALKARRSDEVGEAFISCASGAKVAFLTKPSNWSHKGKPKHDLPMAGKTWQGPIETDESTGLQQIQVAVPVMDGKKPIGSLVVGLAITKLR